MDHTRAKLAAIDTLMVEPNSACAQIGGNQATRYSINMEPRAHGMGQRRNTKANHVEFKQAAKHINQKADIFLQVRIGRQME